MLRALARQNGPIILSQSGVPVGIPSSGSIGNNGALTLTTALPTTYAGIYLYFPANAIFTGSAAGLYYCVMSSTTVGTIYNNTYSSGDPTIPASPTAFATTGPGAYTQSLTEITLRSVTVPGGIMGLSGALRETNLWAVNNSANNKTMNDKFAGNSFMATALTTSNTIETQKQVRNAGSASVQVVHNSVSIAAASGAAIAYLTVNTAADQTKTCTATLANASDWIILAGATTEVLPS